MKTFLDTNVLVYSVDTTDPAKNAKAVSIVQDALVNRRAYAISPQALSEFANVALGKLGLAPDAVLDFLTRLPYSPYIEWYEEDDYQWTQVTVQEFKNEERTDSPSHPYEVTLLCPAINMQF